MTKFKQMTRIIFFLVVSVFLCACNPGNIKEEIKTLPANFKALQNKSISADSVISLVNGLDSTYTEDNLFWENILSDTSYDITNRRICAVKYIERFVKPGTSLEDFPTISNLLDTLEQKYMFVFELDTLLRRKVIRGGSWKDIAYYLGFGQLDNDTVFKSFKMKMRRKGYKLFYVKLQEHHTTDFRGMMDGFSIGFAIAIKGNVKEEDLDAFFRGQKSNLHIKSTVQGIYGVAKRKPSTYLRRNGNDDL